MTLPKIKKRADGRYEKIVTLHDGLTGESYTKHVYARLQSELEEKIDKLKYEVEGLTRNNYTVAQWIDYYMRARRENDPGTTTLDTYDGMIRNYIAGTSFSRLRMDSVNIPVCRRFLQGFRSRANVDGGRTKQMLFTLLHAIFRQAWREKVIKENPFDFIDKPRHQAKERLTLTKAEFNSMLGVIPSEQMRRIFIFARNTGMRRGEICGLRIMDLFLDENYVFVRHGIKLHAGELKLGTLKTKNSTRTIAIPPVIVDLLKEQINFVSKKAERRHKKITPESFVFQSKTGSFLDPNSLTRAFTDARKTLGYPPEMTFHSLRATVATYLAEHDINPHKIQAKLGHSTPTMTLTRYIKHTPEMESSIVNLLQEM